MSLSHNLNETGSDSQRTSISPTAQGTDATPELTPHQASNVAVSEESGAPTSTSAQNPATSLTDSRPPGIMTPEQYSRLMSELQDRLRRAPPVLPTPEEMALLEQIQAAEAGSVEQARCRILLRQSLRLRLADRRAYLFGPLDEAIEKARNELAELQAEQLKIRIQTVYVRLEGLLFEQGHPEIERLRAELFRLLHQLFQLRPEEYDGYAELVPRPTTPPTTGPAAENDTADDMDEDADNDGDEGIGELAEMED